MAPLQKMTNDREKMSSYDAHLCFVALAKQLGYEAKDLQLLYLDVTIFGLKDHLPTLPEQPLNREYTIQMRTVQLWQQYTGNENSIVIWNNTANPSKVGSEVAAEPFIESDTVAEYIFDRNAVTHRADKFKHSLCLFQIKEKTTGKRILINLSPVRRVANPLVATGAEVSERSETSFGYSVVPVESLIAGWGGYGWGSVNYYDVNKVLKDYFKTGQRNFPGGAYATDLISEDIARTFILGINAMFRGMVPVSGFTDSHFIKMREISFGQFFVSWKRWASGKALVQ